VTPFALQSSVYARIAAFKKHIGFSLVIQGDAELAAAVAPYAEKWAI
jgi:hypothetical protein